MPRAALCFGQMTIQSRTGLSLSNMPALRRKRYFSSVTVHFGLIFVSRRWFAKSLLQTRKGTSVLLPQTTIKEKPMPHPWKTLTFQKLCSIRNVGKESNKSTKLSELPLKAMVSTSHPFYLRKGLF